MGSILGSKPNRSTNESSGSGASISDSNSIALSNSEGRSTSFSRTTPGFTGELGKVLQSSLNGTSGFSKDDAVADVQGLLKQQATDALQSVMPNIARNTIATGGYNSTTKELLQNDASARITAQLASTLTDTIGKYAAADAARTGAFADATRAATASESGSESTQNSTSDSRSNSTSRSAYNQNSNGSSRGGGSGLLGLFADGGEVPEPVNFPLRQFMSDSGIMDGMTKVGEAASGMIEGSKEMKEFLEMKEMAETVSAIFGFADGGQVPQNRAQQLSPDNIWARTRQSREEAAGLNDTGAGQGITINVNTGGSQGQQKQQESKPQPSAGDQILQMIRQQLGFADGGQIPPNVDTSKVRNGQSDVEAGGKIRGPQTKDGKDNQIIAVGGGEGIIPKDVMEVPGVAEGLRTLIQRYHTPVKQ